MGMGPEDISYFAETDFRNRKTKFGIKQIDRLRHMYVIGKTGMGKSTLLENIAVQDIQNGSGLCFLDPHGQSAELLLDYVPENRIDDILYFAPFDLEYPIAFNVLEDVGPDRRHLVASGLMSAFKKIWVDAWSARMEYLLNNAMLALLEYPDSTLLSVNRMFADKVYRKNVVTNITDVSVKAFWVNEFEKYNERYAQEATAAIQNKVGQFTANPLVRNIVGQSKSRFDIRQFMDTEKVIIANLSKGRLGEDNANLLGSMLITKLYLGAMSRADLPLYESQKLPPFYFMVDEFQTFANESFANILSEARKYKLALTVAHQYIEQMTDEISAAVFGNVGTMIAFRVGPHDAETFEKEFYPQFTKEDLINQGARQIYLRLMIDGAGSKPFSANTLPPIPELTQSFKDIIIDRSREKFAQPRDRVEYALKNWHVSPIGMLQEDGSALLPGGNVQTLHASKPENSLKQLNDINHKHIPQHKPITDVPKHNVDSRKKKELIEDNSKVRTEHSVQSDTNNSFVNREHEHSTISQNNKTRKRKRNKNKDSSIYQSQPQPKDAFHGMSPEEFERFMVSEEPQSKVGTPEHLSDLKSALEALKKKVDQHSEKEDKRLSDTGSTLEEEEVVTRITPSSDTVSNNPTPDVTPKATDKSDASTDNTPNNKDEIPEDVLRNLLKVDNPS
jgi:hypothetical protein